MIPKLDISAPDFLLRCFYFPGVYGPQEKLEEDINKFKDFFEEYGEEILIEIEKFSGYPWHQEKIPVYLVPVSNVAPKYSFSKHNLEGDLHGVIQLLGRGIRDFHIHIHELVHVNQRQSEFYHKDGPAFTKKGDRNADLLELCADIVTMYVIRNVFGVPSEYEEDMWNFLQKTSDKNLRKNELLVKYLDNWDLNKESLKYYLGENKDKLENL